MSSLRSLALLGLLGLACCGPDHRAECRESPNLYDCRRACDDGDAVCCEVTAGLTALQDIDSPSTMRAAADFARRACAIREEARCAGAESWEEIALTLEARAAGLPAEDDDPAAGTPAGP